MEAVATAPEPLEAAEKEVVARVAARAQAATVGLTAAGVLGAAARAAAREEGLEALAGAEEEGVVGYKAPNHQQTRAHGREDRGRQSP